MLLQNGVGTCNAQSANSGFYVSEPPPVGAAFVVSNGNCGYLFDGGVGT